MDKKKLSLALFVILMLFVVALRYQGKKTIAPPETPKQATKVSVKAAADSKAFLQTSQFPGTVVGDQEVKITAKAAGTILFAPNNIGAGIGMGSLLAKIDDTSSLETGDAGLKSVQVQQAELAAQQAKKSYDLAKNTYDDLKKSSTATGTQKDNAKIQKDISKLQYENALLGLTGSVDNHLITSPISGVITNKAVSIGDSVSVGQLIATVSKSANIKVQFYVDQNQRATLTRGQEIFAIDSNGNSTSLIIQNIAGSADQTTKRFLIEAYPNKQTTSTLLAGTIVSVSITTTIKPTSSANLILPLSTIAIGQNESYVFLAENGVAKKAAVTVIGVTGETAEISAQLSPQAMIIVDGNKLIHDGEKIDLQK